MKKEKKLKTVDWVWPAGLGTWIGFGLFSWFMWSGFPQELSVVLSVVLTVLMTNIVLLDTLRAKGFL